KLDRFAEILDDNFSGVRVIRAFVSQRKEKQTFDAQVDDLSKQMMKVSRCSALLSPLTALVVNGAIVFLLWTGIIEIHTGTMDPGTIIAFINYATSILIALIATSNLIVIFTKASASAQRVNEVLEHAPSMKEGHEQLTNTKDKEYAITFDHVSFSYDDSERSLEDISFSIRPNETIGLIGGTGSGKSTLVHLMARFYDATDGQVSFYGRPIQTLTNNSIRDHIAIVSQTCELFNDTILQNITLHEDYATKDIEKALCDVQAMDFIQEMKDGLHTKLTRGGANLSGGQKQRLCIARALLRKADILILDDACSALDFKTDAMLRKALRSYPMTRIIVSQRVGTLLDCDRILVLHDGKLVGFDTHTNLYDTCDVYQEICQTQAIGRDAL
ncbi:MAG: ABC transporter ATP-binding protein, partial [Longicatena sp.]